MFKRGIFLIVGIRPDEQISEEGAARLEADITWKFKHDTGVRLRIVRCDSPEAFRIALEEHRDTTQFVLDYDSLNAGTFAEAGVNVKQSLPDGIYYSAFS